MRLLALGLFLLLLAPAPHSTRYLVVWGMQTNVFPADGKGHDFLSVFDVSDSPNFGELVAMVPVATHSQMAHHANYTMPPNHMLFANDFMAARSYVFDVNDPRHPRVAASFGSAGLYTHPHSFAYLSNGNVLATYQIKGVDGSTPGALVELDGRGRTIRTSDASAPLVDRYIRPYSLLVLEKINRVVTTSAPMPPLDTEEPTRSVQVWRLSDLKLLRTVALPRPKRFHGVASEDSDEAALLSDGKTVLVKTGECGLYRLEGVASAAPSAHFIYDFGYRSCSSVPIVIGTYWIQPCFSGHSIVALDVRDPDHPVEAGYLSLGSDAIPHWLSREPGSNRFAITGFGSLLNRVSFATIDLQDGALALDHRTINFNRSWPDGWKGRAVPHAALFYR
jgi:hypothetical protein